MRWVCAGPVAIPSVTGYACEPLDQRLHNLIWLAARLPLSHSVHS